MDKRSPDEHPELDQLSEPFFSEGLPLGVSYESMLTPWGGPGSEDALLRIDAEAIQVRREKALDGAQHLPDHLRHAQHMLRPHPECGVCVAKFETDVATRFGLPAHILFPPEPFPHWLCA